jgi:hypothetical protein
MLMSSLFSYYNLLTMFYVCLHVVYRWNRDTESAMWCIYHWLLYKYYIGSPLESVEADTLLYLKQMKVLKRGQTTYVTKVLRQLVLNLLGRENVDNPTRFLGTSLTEKEFELIRQNHFIYASFFSLHGILYTFFGEYVHYANIILKVGHDHYQKAHVGSANNMWDTFIKGVSCFAAAQETGKKKYFKMGQIFRAKINKWLDMGNPNVKQFGLLLDAECLAFQGKKYDAIKKYEAAILLAARGGYQQDAALATQRFGEFYLRVMGEQEDAAYHIAQSMKYWGQWGSKAKVRHLQEKYADLLMDHLPLSDYPWPDDFCFEA